MQIGTSTAEAPSAGGSAETAKASVGQPNRAVLIDIFSRASLIRQCCNRFASVIKSGRIAAPYYSLRGQEIVSAAMGAALKQADYLITIYRCLHDPHPNNEIE